MDDNKTNPQVDSSHIVTDIENLIKSHVGQIDKIDEELKQYKEMLDSILQNDEVYTEHDRLAKEAAKIKSKTKQQLMKTSQAMNVSAKLKDLKVQVTEYKSTLSGHLQEYHRLTGSTEIDPGDGNPRQIVYTAKLIKASYKPGK